MEYIRSPWAWFFAYWCIGLLIAGFELVRERLAARRLASMPLPPFCTERGSLSKGPDWIAQLFLGLFLSLIWLPVGLYMMVTERLETYRAAKEAAWRETPEGLAAAEREYREGIERSIQPWIDIEDLTQRNVPWSEFDVDYQESKTLFQRDCDLFEAFVAKFQAGDEMASFSTHEETWKRMHGRAGWAIVRDSRIIAQHVTIMN